MSWGAGHQPVSSKAPGLSSAPQHTTANTAHGHAGGQAGKLTSVALVHADSSAVAWCGSTWQRGATDCGKTLTCMCVPARCVRHSGRASVLTASCSRGACIVPAAALAAAAGWRCWCVRQLVALLPTSSSVRLGWRGACWCSCCCGHGAAVTPGGSTTGILAAGCWWRVCCAPNPQRPRLEPCSSARQIAQV